jgi:hypothetical protein
VDVPVNHALFTLVKLVERGARERGPEHSRSFSTVHRSSDAK